MASKPHDGALLTQPGPTLDDVMAELHMQRGAPLSKEAIQLVNDVSDAFTEEASDLCEEAGMVFAAAHDGTGILSAPQHNDQADAKEGVRPHVTVRHRFDRRDDDQGDAARSTPRVNGSPVLEWNASSAHHMGDS